ncbi:uncharacterized protein LOC103725205 [Nannospalax galili]|uniref:uncharacterized protein LOC103725205 n=1 Tax=Nannospalax galili TaxID=1026970 RepID=UPI0004ED5C68|nr:uncharacterized protein LOC103725205 [Nannospalax galili]
MLDCTFMLTRILFVCCFLMVHCSQPNCTSVTDFDDCPGNITDFCPRNIVCACKDGEPFCKCPNFRGQWGNYWYMGANCHQLWNTLDLILVATLPGIGLALIVGVAIQITYYCKERSKKSGDHPREERSLSGLQPHYNSAYGFDADRSLPEPNRGQNPRSSAHQGAFSGSTFSPFPPLSRVNSNFAVPAPREGAIYNYPSNNWDRFPGPTKPEINYGNKYSSNTHMKPFYEFPTSGVPRAVYLPK